MVQLTGLGSAGRIVLTCLNSLSKFEGGHETVRARLGGHFLSPNRACTVWCPSVL